MNKAFCLLTAISFLLGTSAFAQEEISAYAQQKKQNGDKQIPCSPSYVYLSSPCYTFEADLTALYMQPSSNNLDYAAEAIPLDFAVPVPPVSPNWVIPQISPDYHWGFDVGIAGIFHDANSKLALDWEWFHTSTDSNSKNVAVYNMVGPFFAIGPDTDLFKKTTGTVNYHFDEVNLTYGTLVNFGQNLCLNLFSGASFSRIVQHRKTTFTNYAHSITQTITVPATFIGAGPQIGVDFTYKIAGGFQFVGNSKATLFVGTLKNSTTYVTDSTALELLGGPNPNVQTTTVYSKGGVIPGLEGKLGFGYDFLFCSRYMVKLEAGYQAQIYLNAIRSIDMGSQVEDLSLVGLSVTDETGVYARTFQRTVSDFALAGAYFNIDFGF